MMNQKWKRLWVMRVRRPVVVNLKIKYEKLFPNLNRIWKMQNIGVQFRILTFDPETNFQLQKNTLNMITKINFKKVSKYSQL